MAAAGLPSWLKGIGGDARVDSGKSKEPPAPSRMAAVSPTPCRPTTPLQALQADPGLSAAVSIEQEPRTGPPLGRNGLEGFSVRPAERRGLLG